MAVPIDPPALGGGLLVLVILLAHDDVLREFLQRLLVGDDSRAGHRGERREHLRDVPPPRLSVFPVPVYRCCQALREARLLLPSQLPQLRTVHRVPVVVERPVPRVLDPSV